MARAAAGSPAALFRQTAGAGARAAVVARALVGKIARLLYVPAENIDQGKRLSDYGVDSLVAVEMRNWIRHDFQASVAVFDIMGDRTITGIADMVVERSAL